MPGKLLIIDSIATNRIVLKVRLKNAHYSVLQATCSADAKAVIARDRPDLILVNAQVDGCDAIEFCKQLRAAPATAHLPIVLISADQDRSERLRALGAGINDVLVRPLDDVVLLARLRSLLRSHETAEESKLREKTSKALGFAEQPNSFTRQPRIVLATPDSATAALWSRLLGSTVPYQVIPKIHGETLKDLANAPVPDVFVIAVDQAKPETALRLIAEIRARASTRHAGILVVLENERRRIMVDAMDLGAHDVMSYGFDPDEMALRVSTLVSQKRLFDRHRDTVTSGLEAAVTDPLTGLFNRRYALPHLASLNDQACQKNRNFAVMMADLDHFKAINDQYGHAAGDIVLTEVARCLRENLRGIDLVARVGGEEFLIAVPEADAQRADDTAARLCAVIRDNPVTVPGQRAPIFVTMSIGVVLAGAGFPSKPVQCLMQQADKALYDAKFRGRDQVRFAKVPA